MLAKPASALASCSSPGATIAKHHGWGDRLSQFRRPEVQGQGIGRVRFTPTPLSSACLLPACPHGLSAVHVHV